MFLNMVFTIQIHSFSCIIMLCFVSQKGVWFKLENFVLSQVHPLVALNVVL